MYRIGEVQKVADGLGGPAFEDELVHNAWSERDNPGDGMTVVGDLDRLTVNHALQDSARLLPQLSYAYTVTHWVHRNFTWFGGSVHLEASATS